MRFYGETFFCDKGKSPNIFMYYDKDDKNWPYTIKISSGKEYDPSILLHFASEADVINFKNQVRSAFEGLKKINQ